MSVFCRSRYDNMQKRQSRDNQLKFYELTKMMERFTEAPYTDRNKQLRILCGYIQSLFCVIKRGKRMFEELERINERPEPFQYYTASDLWADEHTSKQMLSFHLNEAIDVSSRNTEPDASGPTSTTAFCRTSSASAKRPKSAASWPVRASTK